MRMLQEMVVPALDIRTHGKHDYLALVTWDLGAADEQPQVCDDCFEKEVA